MEPRISHQVPPYSPSGRRKWLWTASVLLAAVAVAAGSYYYYTYEFQRIRQQKLEELAFIGQLKIRQIEEWRAESLADVRATTSGPLLRRALQKWLREPYDKELQGLLTERLMVRRQAGGYSDVLVLDPEGRVLLSAQSPPEPLNPAEERAVREAVESRSAVLSELYHASQGAIMMDATAPILDSKGEPMAVGVFRIDAQSRLYPLISSWPAMSASGETLLVRNEGEKVLFLNRLRHRDNTALSLSLPLTQLDLPAVQVAMGKTGPFYGRDYRGVEVLAYLGAVPGSAWFMVAKVDKSELMKEALDRGYAIAVLSGLFILLTALTVAWFYRYRQYSLYKNLYQVEKAQRQIEQKFRTTLYSIGDAVITTDTAGLVQQMNPRAEELTRWQEYEAVGKPLYEVFRIVNEHSREVVENPVEKVLRYGEVIGLANHSVLISRDGTERPIADSGAPIRDQDGTVHGVVLVFRDQTEERASTARLADREQRLRIIADHVYDWEYWLTPDNQIEYCSPSCLRLSGYRADEFLSDPGLIRRITYRDDLAIYDQHAAIADSSTEMCEKDYRITARNGEVVWVSHCCTPVYGNTGEPLGRRISNRDITDRKRAEIQLRESEARYRQLADVTFEAILFHNKGVFLEANNQFYRMFGYERDEILGTQVLEKILNHDSIGKVKNHIESGSTTPYEVVGLKKDGTTFPIEVRPGALEREGRWIRAVAILDLSERKALEAKLLQAQKMEAVGTLAGGIAHDFNNILQVVCGYSEIMLASKKLDDAQRESIRKVHTAGKRGTELVGNIMTFSRKVEPKLQPVDINHQVAEFHKLISRTIPKIVRIDLSLAEDVQPIMADPSQIGQVLMNLAVNSRDAMPDGGTLGISTAMAIVNEEFCARHPGMRPGKYAALSVSDTGTGMDEETVARMFDPFFTTKERGKGTGLGLATVYGIVKQHQGHITCHSEPGLGTTFKIYLPATESELTEESSKEEARVWGGTETILVADDEEAVRDIVQQMLTEYGYTVVTASDGKEALAAYQAGQESISLIILDLDMPELDGSACLKEILRLSPEAKVIIATGLSHAGILSDVQALGARGLVIKPFDARALLQTARKVLDGA